MSKEIYINQNGIRIVKACCSCVHHYHAGSRSDNERVGNIKCDLKNKSAARDYICQEYQMEDKYETIGGNKADNMDDIGYLGFKSGWRACEEWFQHGRCPKVLIRKQFKQRFMRNLDEPLEPLEKRIEDVNNEEKDDEEQAE
jgi:hypothetical protein